RAVGIACNADGAAGSLRDHVEREAVLVRAAGAEALDLAIDNARIDLPDLVVTKPQPLDGAGAMFSTVTSAFFNSSRTISSPRGDFRFKVTDLLLALN